MEKIYLSVVIPSYDEIVNLRKGVLEKVKLFLDKQKYKYEVIVVDDGSTDGSREFVEKFTKQHSSFRLIKNNHTGKAGAVTAGMLDAKGQVVLFTDMDQATPIEEVEKLLPFFQEGYDIVIGSRGAVRKGAPLSRRTISLGYIMLRKMIIGMPDIADTQCGFKAFKREVAQKLFKKVHDFHKGYGVISGSAVKAGFDMELLYLAKKMGYLVKEVPVEWLYVETRRVSPIRDSLDGVKSLIEIKLNDLRGNYAV